MTSSLTTVFRATALAAIASVSMSAFADFDANIELNNTYQNNSRGLTQDGRVEVNASKKVGTKYFMAGRASLLAKKDGGVSTDDMWAQFGTDSADIKLGRFEAANLFQTPGDTLVSHAGFSPYNAGDLRGRKDLNLFHAAGTMKFGGGLALEVGVIETKLAGMAKGIRPVLTYANGPMNAALGFEAVKYNGNAGMAATQTVGIVNGAVGIINTPAVAGTNSVSRSGVGVTGGYDFGGFALTANFTSGKSMANYRRTGLGLIATMGPLNAGVLMGTDKTAGEDAKVTTFYASYAIPFFDIKGATITPAVSFSKGGGSNKAADDSGIRLRINYVF